MCVFSVYNGLVDSPINWPISVKGRMKMKKKKAILSTVVFTLTAMLSACSCAGSGNIDATQPSTVASTNSTVATTSVATTSEATTVKPTQETTQSATETQPTEQETKAEQSSQTSQSSTNEKKNFGSIDEMIENMSVEEKVGQMFYVRCPSSNAVEYVSKYHLGGYILFGVDFEGKSKSEVISDIQSYQDAAEIPLLIGVDEEGGSVTRVSDNPQLRSTPFLSPRNVFAEGGWAAIDADAKEKAELLLSLGINVNMAPVCDITSDKDSFMYYRSFSADANEQCEFVRRTVAISQNKGLGTVLKHFPGYGDNEDTHTGIAYDNRDYSEFVEKDFKPFKTGVNSGADCVLVSHNIVSCMDSEYPASLSEKVHSILREELAFDGVVMTDDLYMDAIRDYTGSESAAVFAAKCGNDILCCTDVEQQYPAVVNAVKNGEIPIEQINKSVNRILKWKQKLGIL